MQGINKYLEHTYLTPTFTDKDVYRLVDDADRYDLLGICVPPFWVKKARRELGADTNIQLITVIGFPLGYQMIETKIEEIKLALRDGTDELDVVMNISAFKAGMPWVKIEFARLAQLIHEHEQIFKVIIETPYLSDEEILKAAKYCSDTGVDFVKTSTGFAGEPTKKEHVELLRKILPEDVGIKASGGIKTLKQAHDFIQAGANRIGTSSALSIMNEINS